MISLTQVLSIFVVWFLFTGTGALACWMLYTSFIQPKIEVTERQELPKEISPVASDYDILDLYPEHQDKPDSYPTDTGITEELQWKHGTFNVMTGTENIAFVKPSDCLFRVEVYILDKVDGLKAEDKLYIDHTIPSSSAESAYKEVLEFYDIDEKTTACYAKVKNLSKDEGKTFGSICYPFYPFK